MPKIKFFLTSLFGFGDGEGEGEGYGEPYGVPGGVFIYYIFFKKILLTVVKMKRFKTSTYTMK